MALCGASLIILFVGVFANWSPNFSLAESISFSRFQHSSKINLETSKINLGLPLMSKINLGLPLMPKINLGLP
jgi:hypothetical protein